MSENAPFIGTGWSFPPRFVKTARGVSTSSGVEDISDSLAVLLSTSLGERIMRPSYGCNLNEDLFESLDASFTAYLKEKVRVAVLYHEPRIKLDSIRIQPQELEGRVDITLEYTVRGTNTRANMVHPFYLAEGSEVGP